MLPFILNLEPLSSLLPEERCDDCGEPDNCGDCDHTPLSEAELTELGLYRDKPAYEGTDPYTNTPGE
jgi:hypothetical protein